MKSIALQYGLYFFGGLLVFFLFSHLLGISENYNLRVANGLIHFTVLYYAIKQLRRRQPETLHNYVSGVAMGIYTGFVGTFLFTVFMVLFLAFNPLFLGRLQELTGLGISLTPITAGVFIVMEGIGVSLLASYLLTRYVDMRIERKSPASYYAK